MNLLTIENLRTYFWSRPKRAFVRSVDGVSLAAARGETLGVVGESGSGKTVTALSAAGLVTGSPGVIDGRHPFRHAGNLLDGLEALRAHARSATGASWPCRRTSGAGAATRASSWPACAGRRSP